MPASIAFRTQYAEHADRFEIVTIHDKSVKILADLGAKLAPIQAKYWGGKPLPFPILLDATGATEERFGIEAHPTKLLIDPAGNLVGEAELGDLAKKLPPVRAEVAWAAQRDRSTGFAFQFKPGEAGQFARFAEVLKRHTHCDVELDAAAITAAGLDPAGPMPTVSSVGVESWRSRVELHLEPHGLGVVPSADGKKLLITKCPPIGGPPSPLQRMRNADLAARLGRPATPLALDGVPLAEAIGLLHAEYGIALALDPKATDPAAKVQAKLGPGKLGDGLTAMLLPLGLRHEVRAEVVWITVK